MSSLPQPLATSVPKCVILFQTSENFAFAHIVPLPRIISYLVHLSRVYIYCIIGVYLLFQKYNTGKLHMFQAPVSKESHLWTPVKCGSPDTCDSLHWCESPSSTDSHRALLPCSTDPCNLTFLLSVLQYYPLSSLKNQWSINPHTVWNLSGIKQNYSLFYYAPVCLWLNNKSSRLKTYSICTLIRAF
jgi:hypothetical protein